ncbi:MAG: hypothetical protein GY903_04295 [Fuerstiella sp.]|nr:hypothetical protein [Fuerstiella sp.]
MTSQLLRNHRITRWNIPATSNLRYLHGRTLSSGILCLTICGTLLIGTTTAQQRSVPVLKATPNVAGNPAEAAFVSKLIAKNTKVESAGPTTPVPPVPTSESSQALARSRALLNDLRNSRNAAAIPVPSPLTPKLQTNDILLTAQEDGLAGVVTSSSMSLMLNEGHDGSPNRLPRPPTTIIDDGPGVAQISDDAHTYAVPSHSGAQQQQFNRTSGANRRKQRRRSRSFHDRITHWTAGMIEFYDPDFEESSDTDDYEMKILLVSGEEESSDDVADEESQGSGLLSRKISDIKPSLDYAWGQYTTKQLPDDFHQRMDHGTYVAKTAPRTVLQWAPSNLWYHPLYFEDPGLERYGHTRHPLIQPFASTGRFFGQVAGLPYQVALHPYHSREYALGYYQPGEWAPKKKYQIPFNEEAAASEFLWITALVLLIP